MGSDTIPGAPAGPGLERRVKRYDFMRPDKFSLDQIRTMSIIHEPFARQATTALSAQLRSLAHLHVASVDQLTYEEFIRSIPNPTTLAVISMEPLKGAALLELDPAVTFALVDRLFGGKGADGGLRRDLTDFEAAIMEGAITRLLGCLSPGWTTIVDLKPRLTAVETNPQFVQIVPPREMIVLVTLDCMVGESKGMINLCIPYLTIEPIIPKLSVQYIYSSMRRRHEGPFARVASLPVTAEICFEGERISLEALSRLKKGALIGIPRYAEGAAFLQAGGAPFLKMKARRAGRDRRVTWLLEDPGVARDLHTLGGVGAAAQESKTDLLQETLRSISADMSAAMKQVEGRITELSRRQEEISDHLLLPGAEGAPAPEDRAARHLPFGTVGINDCKAIATFLAGEHPQLIALVLSYLEPGLAACVLAGIPEEVRTEAAARICTMDRTAPEVLRAVEQVLLRKLVSFSSPDYIPAGGVQAAVEILNLSARSMERGIVESLEKANPGLAEEIKKRMFVFEDIVLLDRTALAAVLRQTPPEDLLLAMKTSPEEVCTVIWECLPKADVDGLKARLSAMGRARLADVDAAQQRVVGVIRRMDEEGRIVVARADETVG